MALKRFHDQGNLYERVFWRAVSEGEFMAFMAWGRAAGSRHSAGTESLHVETTTITQKAENDTGF